MPYFKIETSQKIKDADADKLSKDASSFLSGLLGKPEHVIMVSVCQGMRILFNQTTAPAAYVVIKSIGLPAEKCPGYAEAVYDFLEDAIGVPADRIYIDFADINGSMFGWNRQTF